MKKVVIYGRVSTNKQTVENQLNQLREISQRNDWEIVDEYLVYVVSPFGTTSSTI